MRKTAKWLAAIALAVFAVDWGCVGIKLLNGNYDVTAGARIGGIAFAVFFVCVLYVKCTNLCPHCGREIC